jgi:transcriptional regulator with XRE-family HTH domain
MTNNERLAELRAYYKLSLKHLAYLLDMSPSGISSWLAEPGTVNHRNMPSRILELLEYKLKDPKFTPPRTRKV